jgi:hypothetical protein
MEKKTSAEGFEGGFKPAYYVEKQQAWSTPVVV